jgi:hypothetical protein
MLIGNRSIADTLDVCLTGCRFNSVQAAIDAAANGDLIRVASGTYVDTLIVKKNISLQGGYSGPPHWERNVSIYSTVLDGKGMGRVLAISDTVSPIIDGFIITGGNAGNGGGVGIIGSSPTLSHNIIRNNRASDKGGGLWIIGRSASPIIDGNKITDNFALDGGGVFINDLSSPLLINNVIAKNGARSNGDGVYVDFYSTPSIINNTIANNNNRIVDDLGTSPIGVFIWTGLSFHTPPSPRVLNNIIVNHRGGGIGVQGENVTLDQNSIFDYNNVWNNGTNYGVPCGIHDISDDPRFRNPDSNDYHIQHNSIVIDKGTSDGAPVTDIDGDNRYSGKGVDIGADEDTMNITQPPAIPSLVSPPNGSTEVTRYLTLHWNTTGGLWPISYRVQVSTDSCFSYSRLFPGIIEQRGITDTTYVLGFNLFPNTKYFWRVDASNQLGTSIWSNVWSFTTTAAPGRPELFSPANGAIDQPTVLTLGWEYNSRVTYRLQVSTDSSFNTAVFDSSGIEIGSHDVGPLSNNTTYYWRVQAKNIYGSGPLSSAWSFTTVDIPTNVNISDNMPREFSLGQNYPNPFNPSTTIEYALPKPSHVELKLFDILGKEVQMLVSRKQPAGEHRAQFDSNGMPAGVYFYRIKAGEFVQTKKLTLVK